MGEGRDDPRRRGQRPDRPGPGGQYPSGQGPDGVGPNGPERTAAHRQGPPIRPMHPDGRTGRFAAEDTGFVDRIREDEPVDMTAVRRDDALLDAIAGGGTVSTDTPAEYALASLLADWRDEIVTSPVPQKPTVDEVLAAPVQTSRRRSARRFQIIAGAAAAFVAVAVTGGVFVHKAQPGDSLWDAKQAMFAQQASETLATSAAKAQLGQASAALDSGDTAAVRTALAQAKAKSRTVRDAGVRAQLEQQVRDLEAAVGTPGGTAPSSAASRPDNPTREPGPESRPQLPGTEGGGPTAAGVPNPGRDPSDRLPSTAGPTAPVETSTVDPRVLRAPTSKHPTSPRQTPSRTDAPTTTTEPTVTSGPSADAQTTGPITTTVPKRTTAPR